MSVGRTLPDDLHSGIVPGYSPCRSWIKDNRCKKHRNLQVARRHLLSPVHHPFPIDIHADELGRGKRLRTTVAAHCRLFWSILPFHSAGMGPLGFLRCTGAPMAEGTSVQVTLSESSVLPKTYRSFWEALFSIYASIRCSAALLGSINGLFCRSIEICGDLVRWFLGNIGKAT